MQQPTSGVTLKSYVSGCNCSWMNGKASKLLPLPPSLPPPGTWSKHHTLLWVAPESQPWPPLQPLCARGRRGSPYPFLIDTHTEWHWPTPDSLPPSSCGTAILRMWRHRCESHCRRFWNTHVCHHRTHVNRQGCTQSRLCAEDNTDASRQQCVVRRMKAAASLMGGGSAWRRGWGEMSKGWGGLTCHSQQMLCCSISLHPVSWHIHKH